MTDQQWCDHVCESCRAGAHRNCADTAWCFRDDVPTVCACLVCELDRNAS